MDRLYRRSRTCLKFKMFSYHMPTCRKVWLIIWHRGVCHLFFLLFFLNYNFVFWHIILLIFISHFIASNVSLTFQFLVAIFHIEWNFWRQPLATEGIQVKCLTFDFYCVVGVNEEHCTTLQINTTTSATVLHVSIYIYIH